jgi:hypothetical protein
MEAAKPASPPASDRRQELTERLLRAGIDPIGAWPVDAYIGHFDALTQPCAYDRVPEAAAAASRAIVAAAGEAALEDYHRLVLLTLIGQREARAARHQVPAWLLPACHDYGAMVERELARPKPGYYRLTNDPFLKDLAVCRQKLWPCGAELVDPCSGVPRRTLAQGGIGQMVAALRYFGLGAGGFAPFYESHFDPRLARQFTPDGYRQLYRTIARLLEQAPAVRGMFSGSWWHDPAVAAISPNLAFLNEIPLAGGARLFRAGTDPRTVKLATRLSKERSRLYQAGRYQPTAYILVWGRRELLAWARAAQPAAA